MIRRAAVVAFLALAVFTGGCKGKSDPGETAPTGAEPSGAPSGDKPAVSAPSGNRAPTSAGDWKQRTGPGFTIDAPNEPKIEHITPEDKRDKPFDRYTFFAAGDEAYVVEVTEITKPGTNWSLQIATLRDRLAGTTQAVTEETFPEGGDGQAMDLRYYVEKGRKTLRARSRIMAKEPRMFEIRAETGDSKEREAIGDKFVTSFAFAP